MSVTDIFEDQKKSADLTVIVGVVVLVGGAFALAWPGLTLGALAVAFGVATLCYGVALLTSGIAGTAGTSRVGELLVGVLAVLAGVLSLHERGGTLLFLVLASGSWLVISGLIDVVGGIADDVPGRGWRIAAGVVDGIASMLILAWPSLGLATLALFVGVALTVRGGILIASGISVHRAASELNRDVQDIRSTSHFVAR